MKKAEVDAAYNEISSLAGIMSGKLTAVVGPNPAGMLAVQGYEATRRLEDFMSRVGHCMALAMGRTDEAIDAAAEKKGMGEVIQFPTADMAAPEGKVE